ncbi:MAG: nitroreductase family deazaflavin-dependent oxidoreductase [bacterium]|nr:nitroreductase family deazaflavin-dependent oxidoreductase [bacterium]
MPMPLWFGHVNKRLFNRSVIKKGTRPVLTHVGRSSGTVYQTPLDAHQVEDGYIFILVYGSRSDWVQNILAAGNATLTIDDEEHELVTPRVVTKEEAWPLMPAGTKQPPGLLNVTEFLQMDIRK